MPTVDLKQYGEAMSFLDSPLRTSSFCSPSVAFRRHFQSQSDHARGCAWYFSGACEPTTTSHHWALPRLLASLPTYLVHPTSLAALAQARRTWSIKPQDHHHGRHTGL